MKLAERWSRAASKGVRTGADADVDDALMLAAAYPRADRAARGKPGEVLLASGRGVYP
jgi:ATP-dependent helicase HrpB